MLARIENTILAIVNGSLTVAFVQALVAGAMYTILGVPAPVIWASVTFVVALIPVFGTFLVWGPLALFLLVSGSWIKAAILLGWGILVVAGIGQCALSPSVETAFACIRFPHFRDFGRHLGIRAHGRDPWASQSR